MKHPPIHNKTGLEIAIIGIACRFPGANNHNEFWQNLLDGKESVTELNDELLLGEGISEEIFKSKNYIKSASILDNIKFFDAEFFGITPREAELTDPQQRILMEVIWEALEDSGYNPYNYQNKIALFAGGGINTYLYSNLIQNKSVVPNISDLNVYITNHVDSLATRIAYKLDLKGPAITVQSACSTSLVATHLACQSLLTGDAEIALSAAVKITVPHYTGYHFQEDGIKSKDGHCRPFDENATGTIFGNGAGVVVLKLLTEAIKDNDNIYAVIKGSAINNDGKNKMNYVSPGIVGQVSVIQEAFRNANVSPSSVSYIETHGTATKVGDPIEITALTQATKIPSTKKQFCAIGSVKSNIGHLDVAAGMASLIKTALALKHKIIPASINFNTPNKQINFKDTFFYVNTTLKQWDAIDGIRRAGVSSFGIGGTNAHMILEEFIAPIKKKETGSLRIFPLSAKTKTSLNQAIHNLIQYLTKYEVNFSDMAYTLAIGRNHFSCRKAFIAENIEEFIISLQEYIQNLHLQRNSEISDINLPTSKNNHYNVMEMFVKQWEDGNELDWQAIYRHEKLKKISLPTYVFNKKEYWIPRPQESAPVHEKKINHLSTGTGPESRFLSDENEIINFVIKWIQDILGIVGVQHDDNFFAIGGDSLYAIDLIAKIQEETGVSISISKFFAFPTPKMIAKIICEEEKQQPIKHNTGMEKTNIFPLSAAEKRFWLSEQINPECSAFNVPITFHLDGNLSLAALQEALLLLTKKHECFRSSFRLENKQPIRIVVAVSNMQLEVINCLEELEIENKTKAFNILIEKCKAGFDLEKGPLARAILLQYATNKYFFGLVLHHILVDGHSMSIIVEELNLLYRAVLSKNYTSFPPNDYILSSEHNASTTVIDENQRKFWQDYLSQAIVTKSPFLPDFSVTDTTIIPTKKITEKIDANLLSKLSNIASQEKTTTFVVLLSAWLTLIYRYMGENNFIVGYPINQRGLKQSESGIGPKINTIPFRAELSGDINFMELIQYVHAQHILLLENSNVSFEEIVEICLKDKLKKSQKLVNNFFVYQNTPPVKLSLPDLVAKSFDVDLGYAQHDITLILVPQDMALDCTLEYNTNLFQLGNMQKVLETFLILLHKIVDDPLININKIKLCDHVNENQITREIASNINVPHQTRTVIDLFEKNVMENPLKYATTCVENVLTYGELNSRANQLARYLIKKGGKRGSSIIVQAGRSEIVLVAILAILKIGAVYIPVAPCTLPVRRNNLVKQIKPSIVLTDKLNDFCFTTGIPVISLLDLYEHISIFNTKNLNIKLDDNCLAYVLFTSGSTGEPKGVKVSHRALINNILWRIKEVKLGPDDKILHTISFAFDPSVWQFLGPICSGGCVVIADNRALTDIDYFISLIEMHKITILDFTPSLLRIFLKFVTPLQVNSVRHVFCGGESLDYLLIKQFFNIFSASLFNQYGPTETTIDATYWRVDKHWHGVRAPIGKPIHNVDVYILDQNQNICPVGAIGELYIGGKGVSEGYLDDSELTNLKFVSIENLSSQSKRFYKTGDLGRYLASGDIEYCGRQDSQVKINGIRVDLQEIENVVKCYPAVDISSPQVETSGHLTILILYIQIKKDNTLNYEDFIAFLQSNLPDHMIPKSIKVVESFTYSESGKIDTKSLHNIPSTELRKDIQCEEKLSETEKLIAQIFSEVLEIEYCNINRGFDFFSHGGDSLRAIHAISNLRKVFSSKIYVEILFKHPILSDLAHVLERKEINTKTTFLENNSEIDKNSPITLSFPQKYIWHYSDINVASYLNNVPIFLKLEGSIDLLILEKSINLLIERHEALRTYFVMQKPEIYQYLTQSSNVVIKKYDLTKTIFSNRSKKLQKIFKVFIDKPFDLYSDCLFRCGLMSFKNNIHILVLGFHRLIYDGRTEQNIIKAIFDYYHDLEKGNFISSNFTSLQYRHFIAEEHLITEESIKNKASKISKQFLDYKMTIPFKWKRNLSIQEAKFKVVSFDLDNQIYFNIKEFTRLNGITIFILFLAIIQKSLSKLLKRGKYLIAVPTSGRLDEKFNNVIGRFVNLSLAPMILKEKFSLKKCLNDAKNVGFNILENQNVPIQFVLEEYKKYLKHNYIVKPDIFLGFFDEVASIDNHDLDFSINRVSLLSEKPEFPISINIIHSKTKISIELKYIAVLEKNEIYKLKEIILEELLQVNKHFYFDNENIIGDPV